MWNPLLPQAEAHTQANGTKRNGSPSANAAVQKTNKLAAPPPPDFPEIPDIAVHGISRLTAEQTQQLLARFPIQIVKGNRRARAPSLRSLANQECPFVVKVQPVYACTERHFRNEVDVHRHVNQRVPALAPLLHAAWICEEQERGYMVLERLMDATSLRKWRTSNPLQREDMHALVDLVHQLHHQCGIIHGDLHAENIMRCTAAHSGWTWKLLDFGQSERIESATHDKSTTDDLCELFEDLDIPIKEYVRV